MLSAFIKGISQLSDPATRKIVWIAFGGAVATFILLWMVLGVLLYSTSLFQIAWLETIIDTLGGAAVLLLTWFLFPAVVSAVTSIFLEKAADQVEAKYYPDLPPASGLPLPKALLEAAKFLGILIGLYLLMLPLLLFPPIFPFVFYSVTGYLLGREFFELVAFRRLPPVEARALRKKHGVQVFLAGVLTAFLMTIPVANLLMPLVATAAMVHLFQRLNKPQILSSLNLDKSRANNVL